MSTDAPLGELHWEPEVHDAPRVRARDAAVRARGGVLLVTLPARWRRAASSRSP